MSNTAVPAIVEAAADFELLTKPLYLHTRARLSHVRSPAPSSWCASRRMIARMGAGTVSMRAGHMPSRCRLVAS